MYIICCVIRCALLLLALVYFSLPSVEIMILDLFLDMPQKNSTANLIGMRTPGKLQILVKPSFKYTYFRKLTYLYTRVQKTTIKTT